MPRRILDYLLRLGHIPMSGGIEYRSQSAHLVVHIEYPVLHFLFHGVFSLRPTFLMFQRFG